MNDNQSHGGAMPENDKPDVIVIYYRNPRNVLPSLKYFDEHIVPLIEDFKWTGVMGMKCPVITDELGAWIEEHDFQYDLEWDNWCVLTITFKRKVIPGQLYKHLDAMRDLAFGVSLRYTYYSHCDYLERIEKTVKEFDANYPVRVCAE